MNINIFTLDFSEGLWKGIFRFLFLIYWKNEENILTLNLFPVLIYILIWNIIF